MANIPSISEYGSTARGYAEFFDGIPAAIFRTTVEGKIVYCNRAFAQLFGFNAASELFDFPVIELYRNKKDRGVFIHSILQRGLLVDLPISFKMRNGTSIWCAVTAKAVLDDDDVVVHIDGVLRDITGEIEVKEAAPRLNGNADDIHDAVIIIDLQGQLIDINKVGAELIGFPKEEMLGQPISGLFVPDDREFFLIFLTDLLKIGRNEAILTIITQKSKKRHLDWHAYLVRNHGRPQHIKCIARDVTDIVIKQMERNIDEKFKGVLEMAGGVAHSLNQPLTIVNNLLNEVLSELQPDGRIYPKILKVYDQLKKMNDIAKKIGSIKKYAAMDYVAGIKIVDIEKASWAQKFEDNS